LSLELDQACNELIASGKVTRLPLRGTES